MQNGGFPLLYGLLECRIFAKIILTKNDTTMKRTIINFSFLFFCLIYSHNAICYEWETIIPEAWKLYVPEHCEFICRKARHLNYISGENPLTGNVTIPPYVIERKPDDAYGGIMIINTIAGGIHPGWIAYAPNSNRVGYSENLGLSAPPGMNTNYYGTFYQSDIDTLRLPPTITTIENLAFEQGHVNVLICAAITPPVFGSSYTELSETCKLIVPTGCKAVYQRSDGWSTFAVIEEGAEKYMPEQLVQYDNAWYKLKDDETAMLLNSDNCTSLIIADELEYMGKTYPVTSLGMASINKYAVVNLTLGAHVENFDIVHLQDTYFPNGAFVSTNYNCVALNKINVSADNPHYSSFEGVLYSKDGLELVFLPLLPKYRDYSIFTIPDGVSKISAHAFPKYHKYHLEWTTSDNYNSLYNLNVVIPPSVVLIEEQDTDMGYNLVMTSSSPPQMVSSGFKGRIGVPEGCLYDYLDVYPYNNMNVMETKSISGLSTIRNTPNQVFLETNDYIAYWHHEGQYYELTNLKYSDINLEIPSEIHYGLMSGPIKKIGYLSVPNSNTVRSLIIPEGIEDIERLGNFEILRTISLPQSLKRIGDNCFKGCKYIESITIPANIESIGHLVFKDCKSLVNVYVESNTPPEFSTQSSSVNNNWTYQSLGLADNVVLHVPVGAKSTYLAHPVWGGFSMIVEDVGLTGITSVKGDDSLGWVYDLQGRKIENYTEKNHHLSSGIFIINGKKVFIK